MKFFKYIALGSMALSLGVGASSCVDDLDVTPDDPNKKTELTTPEEWYGYFSSLYGNLRYEGGLTPNGVDGGAGTWMRCHWNLQTITADEAIILSKWNDPGYNDLKFNTWMTDNTWMFMAYQREATSAKLCSEFISKIDGAAAAGVDADLIAQMKSEARVLRAYSYYYMIDLFGKGPWITNEAVGVNAPVLERADLFNAVTAELEDVIANGNLVVSTSQTYGRLSKEAAHMLLAKLYLNAEVYAGTPMYDKCAAHCKEILKTTNTLADDYRYLFCADNDRYVGKGQEIIWAIEQDANYMTTWGGTTYLTAGAYIESVPDEVLNRLGALGQTPWTGLKVRPELPQVFDKDGSSRTSDKRYLFYEGEFQEGVENLDDFSETSDGFMCVKYTYTNSTDYTNEANIALTNQVCNTDYPLFRLADTYLMLGECQKRGVNDADPGFTYFNKVRDRAGLAPITNPTLDEILNERQRELYWEGHRRSDLIRFGKYTGGTYNWSWKGGIYEGKSIDSYRNLFAIPYQYVSTVGQNPGY
ncbi:MAG: RagB/SusD family nutrient uptake outer membrane protein [Barnesiella sp.]|nr:RagB/SusD family nutrient uptake outer membrane protein [Barnesiella sp.]